MMRPALGLRQERARKLSLSCYDCDLDAAKLFMTSFTLVIHLIA